MLFFANKNQRRPVVCLLTLTVVVGIFYLLEDKKAQPVSKSGVEQTVRTPFETDLAQAVPVNKELTAAVRAAIKNRVNRMDQVAAQQELREILRGVEREEAVAWILSYLESGEDYEFDLRFSVSFEGGLATAPTMRVLLLDLLGELDPAASREMATRILEHRGSVDEWAISLRNFVSSGREVGIDHEISERQFVKGKMDEMFSHLPWRENPGPAMLESFDFWVNLGDTESFEKVLEMRDRGNSESIQHAARIAASEFLSVNSRNVVRYLCQEEVVSVVDPKIAGVLLSKADPRDSQQMDTIKGVIQQLDTSDPLANIFFRYFPNFQTSVHPRLISIEPPSPHFSARSKAIAALATLQKWEREEKLEPFNENILEITSYLYDSLK